MLSGLVWAVFAAVGAGAFATAAHATEAVGTETTATETIAAEVPELRRACQQGDTAAVRSLLATPSSDDATSENARRAGFLIAVRQGHIGIAQAFIESGYPLEDDLRSGATALHWAAKAGHTEIVAALLEAGAAVDAKARDGGTPLLWAAGGGHADIVRALAEAGARWDITNKADDTVILLSANNGHAELLGLALDNLDAEPPADLATEIVRMAILSGDQDVLRALLDRDIDALQVPTVQQVEIWVRAEHKHPEMFDVLREYGVDLTIFAEAGARTVEAAISRATVSSIDMLISRGIKPDTRLEDGRTALMVAATSGDRRLVEDMLDFGADLAATDEESRDALWHAIAASSSDVALLLLERGSKADTRLPLSGRQAGWTPLMLAGAQGLDGVVDALLDRGAAVNAVNASGRTALMFAALFGRTGTVHFLLNAGADRTLEDKRGYTATDLAHVDRHLPIVALLQHRPASARPGR